MFDASLRHNGVYVPYRVEANDRAALLWAAALARVGALFGKDPPVPFSSDFLRKACLVSVLALGTSPAIAAEGPAAGAYLAARMATAENDYAAASDYYDRLLLTEPTNPAYQEGALVSHVAVGEYDRARAIANLMMQAKPASNFAALVALAADAQTGDFDKGLALLDAGAAPGPLIAGIYRGWALVGLGRMAEATKVFDDMAKTREMTAIALFHKALALATVGDYEGADAILSGKFTDVFHSMRRGVLAHAEILSQLERDPDALALIDKTFGQGLDPDIVALRDRLSKGERLPFTVVPNAKAGIAEIYLTVAQALVTDKEPSVVPLVHARLASWIRPDFGDPVLVAGSLLDSQGQYDLAIETFNSLPADNPVYPAAQLGRAESLQSAGREDDAIAVLQDLTRARPDLYSAWIALGDDLRRENQFKEAVDAYGKAVALIATPSKRDWFVYFARGISRDKAGDWPGAEQDLREALTLSPDQATVLNYLGYSYVEKKEHLDEALDMIRRAVAASPNEGYITDSLGWAYYRLGRYDDAVTAMEKAVSLEPREPLLNDHLGDVYWAAGRKREAEFQWRRALNLGPGEDLDMDRVRRKLDVGLDEVLKEEGAPPIHPETAQAPAHDD